MTPQQTRFSLKRFMAFLETAASEELAAKGTLKQWREVSDVFSTVLDDHELGDLRQVDVLRLTRRYADALLHRSINITPWRLHQLRGAISHAVGDFIAFAANANGYRRDQRLRWAKQVYLANRGSAPRPRQAVILLAERGSRRVAGAA